MLTAGRALKVTLYLSEGATRHGSPLYSVILDFLFYRGVSGATVSRGIAGFGADHHIHSAHRVEISDNLPIKLEFIEKAEVIEALMPKLEELAGSGLLEMQETTIVKAAQASAAVPPPRVVKIDAPARILRIYTSEEASWSGKPLYRALIEALRANDVAGATVYRGLCGIGFELNEHSKPILITIVDSAEKIEKLLPLLEQMIGNGLLVLSEVEAVRVRCQQVEKAGAEEVKP